MSELAHRPDTDTWVDIVGPVGDLAGKIARTPFVPRAMQGNPAIVAAAILTGRELGLGPMTSLRGLDVIEGKVAMTAQMLLARIYRAGHRVVWVAANDKEARVRIERGDGLGEAEAGWTIGDAQRAGIAGKAVWSKYPRAMLRARALTEAAAMACPDVALGLEGAPDHADTEAAPARIQVHAPEPEPDPQPEPDVVEAEIVEEEEPEPITGPQMRMMSALIRKHEQTTGTPLDREERRNLIARLAGIDQLATAKDLTKEEASRVIDALQAQQ
jgi:hypothetical protein